MRRPGSVRASYRVTVGVSIVVLVFWIVLSVLARSSGETVPTYLTSGGTPRDVLIVVFGPFLHQSHTFVVGNLVTFVLVGVEDASGRPNLNGNTCLPVVLDVADRRSLRG